MYKNPLNKGIIEENSTGVGEISAEMVVDRADELALIAGHQMTLADGDQALRELTGGEKMDDKQALLESISEEDRWNPIPGSKGSQAEQSATEGEDGDGQDESAQLFEEGVSEAAHDQMLQAAIVDEEKGLSD